jgi:hypothetical protein
MAKTKDGSTLLHMSMHWRLLDRLDDADLLTAFGFAGVAEDPTAADVREHLRAEAARGREFWNACEATDPDGTCACPEAAFKKKKGRAVVTSQVTAIRDE